MNHDRSQHDIRPKGFWRSPYSFGLIVLGAIALYFLLTEYRAHLFLALFVEMYGFPLTIYLLSGWLQTGFPALDLLSHDTGHLWSTLLGDTGNPHFGVLHIASYVFLGFGFYLLSSAWNVLYEAQRQKKLAVAGASARIRHPQYVAFVLILLGFLLQWPTLLTLVMFPVLLVMYWRLALTEEAEIRKQFGSAYETCAAQTPRFMPSLKKRSLTTTHQREHWPPVYRTMPRHTER